MSEGITAEPAECCAGGVSFSGETGPQLVSSALDRKNLPMSHENWISIPLTQSIVRGAAQLESTENGVTIHRLPAWARAQCNDPQMLMAESRPSGVRLAFRTTATAIELDILRTIATYAGLAPRPNGFIELIVDGQLVGRSETSGGIVTTIDMGTGEVSQERGSHCTARFANLAPTAKDIQIWLPHNENIELLELRATATVEPAPEPSRPVWLHHGSSISHGSNAVYPTKTWPVIASNMSQIELINLGFAGSSLLDPFVARTIRDQAADMISLKIGINLCNTDLMRLRAFGPAIHGFVDTIREGHPTTPLLFVSPLLCGIHEETPGPGAIDTEALGRGELKFRSTGDPTEVGEGKLTLQVIRAELARIMAQRQADDPHLYYLDGLQLYGEDDAEQFPLPDALHPDAGIHQLIGERFAQLAFSQGGPFCL